MKWYKGNKRKIKKAINFYDKGRFFAFQQDGTYYSFNRWGKLLELVNFVYENKIKIFNPYKGIWEQASSLEWIYTKHRRNSYIFEFELMSETGYHIYDLMDCAYWFPNVEDTVEFQEYTTKIFGKPLTAKEYISYLDGKIQIGQFLSREN